MNESILSKLVGFERELFSASLKNLDDETNPLRFNNFAYSCRELVRHFLHRLSPADNVKQCSWYVAETDSNDGITRRQRVYYAVQGGLEDTFVSETLEIDISETHRQLRGALDDLSKHTHVNESTFGLSEEVVSQKAKEVLSSIAKLFETIDVLRLEIATKLQEEIDAAAVDAALYETIQEIDELATHHYIDEIEVEEIEILSVDDAFIHMRAHGTIFVELQWGSNSDVRNDMGAVAPMQFPFECDLIAPVDEPSAVTSEDGAFRVDVSKWRVHEEE